MERLDKNETIVLAVMAVNRYRKVTPDQVLLVIEKTAGESGLVSGHGVHLAQVFNAMRDLSAKGLIKSEGDGSYSYHDSSAFIIPRA